jgi:antitoxin HicB
MKMIKDLNYYMELHYEIWLKQYEGGSWGAKYPDLPGCVGGGDTALEALEMLEDAKRAWIMDVLADNDVVPEPNLSTLFAL